MVRTTDHSGERILVTLPLTDAQRAEFEELAAGAGAGCMFAAANEVSETDVDGATAVVGNIPAGLLHGQAGLRWLQTYTAGYDQYVAPGLLADATVLTCASGAYGQAVSEHMFAQLLCLMKKLHLYRDRQHEGTWGDEGPVTSLAGATVLVLGTGDIGSSFARLVCALGARAWGVRRRVAEPVEPFERLFSFDQLEGILPQVDVVASVLPSTPETRGLADEAFFAAMRPGSFFVNAGRGDLVDSDALVAALESRRLAGAALDVTNPEPLPAGHPLWQQPNALITPHVSGGWHLQATVDNVVALCRNNLKAYLAGQPLRNVVGR